MSGRVRGQGATGEQGMGTEFRSRNGSSNRQVGVLEPNRPSVGPVACEDRIRVCHEETVVTMGSGLSPHRHSLTSGVHVSSGILELDYHNSHRALGRA